MNKQFSTLLEALLPVEIGCPRELSLDCYNFIKCELSLLPVFHKIPVYILIGLFFIYSASINLGCLFNQLSFQKQADTIITWENLSNITFTLIRLLRNLVYLYYFEHAKRI